MSSAESRKRGRTSPAGGGGRSKKKSKALDASESEVYCVCRQPYDATRPMVMCDACEEWFHPSCLRIPMPGPDDAFTCPACIAAAAAAAESARLPAAPLPAAPLPAALPPDAPPPDAPPPDAPPPAARKRRKRRRRERSSKKPADAANPPPAPLADEDPEVAARRAARAAGVPYAYLACARLGCAAKRAPASKYCSDLCGLRVARLRLAAVVEAAYATDPDAVVAQAADSPFVAEVVAALRAEREAATELVVAPGVAALARVAAGPQPGLPALPPRAADADADDVAPMDVVEARAGPAAVWAADEKELARLAADRARAEAELEAALATLKGVESAIDAVAAEVAADKSADDEGGKRAPGGGDGRACPTCGASVSARAYPAHVNACFRRHDIEYVFGRAVPADERNGGWECGAYDARSKLHCHYYAASCPFHVKPVKVPGVRKHHACGFPAALLLADHPPSDPPVCRAPRSACSTHVGWEDIHTRALAQAAHLLRYQLANIDLATAAIARRRSRDLLLRRPALA